MYLRPGYTVGGSLSVTSTELRFFGGENRGIALQDITHVRVARQRWWHPRKTVQVVVQAQQSTWFLVNHQVQVAQRIVEAVDAAGGQAVQS